MSFLWVVIFCLYSMGWMFEHNERRQIALQICFLSCLVCVILVRCPEINYKIAPLGFAAVDLMAFSLLFFFRFKALSVLVFTSFLCHVVAGLSILGGWLSFYPYYSHIMIVINIGILGILFHGSRGAGMVLELCRTIMDELPNSECRKNLARFESQIYNNELLQAIDKDFK